MPSQIKESKSSVTIRRRRNKHTSHPSSSHARQADKDHELFIDEPENTGDHPVTGPPILQLLMSSDWLLFLGLLAFRGVNALVIQTAFVPDEYWQSLEVAHNMAYGYGYLTWEWKSGLRGYLYPLMFAALYKVLGILHIDNRILLTKVPRLTQAVFAALGDVYLYRFARRLSGVHVARWSLLCQLTSWFTFYCSVRTLTNSLETSLSTVALYYYPWPGSPRVAHWKYLVPVCLAVLTRPTAAIMWLPLCLWHVWRFRHRFFGVIKLFVMVGSPLLILSSLVDRLCYGAWVFVPYNFLAFNVLSGQGTFYGSHPWHWYVTQGFPVIMGSHLVPFVLALRRGGDCNRVMLAVIAWTIFVYSLLGHKEFRFISPTLPLALYLCGLYLRDVTTSTSHTSSKHSAANGAADSSRIVSEQLKSCKTDSDTKSQHSTSMKTVPSKLKSEKESQATSKALGGNVGISTSQTWSLNSKVVLILLVLTNLPLALYTSLIHQRGTVDVMRFVSEEAKYATKYNTMSVFFAMPCHSTPYYSYVHKNVSMRFLTCEPNLNNDPNHIDEADVFYQHPVTWLQEHVVTKEALPSHLVMFNTLYPTMAQLFQPLGYKDCAKFFHAHVVEGRVGSHVMVMCRVTWLEGREKARRHRNFLHM